MRGKPFKKGQIPWNKGKKGVMPTPWNKGLTKETCPKLSNSGVKVGNKPWNTGKKWSENIKKKMGAARKGKTAGKNHPMYGKHHTTEAKNNNRLAHLGKRPSKATEFKKGVSTWNKGIRGKDSHCWLGGKSFEPYSPEFNEELKEQIRKRDNYRCQECFRHQSELPASLNVHHIDFNKKNSHPNNLISLCNSCHVQTNYNRADWTEYFQNQLSRGGF